MKCVHGNIPANKFLVQCPDCKVYFVCKVQNIIAASNGGKTGLRYSFLSSNFLGWYTNEEEFSISLTNS